MDIRKLREQFLIYVLTENSSVLEAEKGLADSRYRISTMSPGDRVLERIKTDPPHVVVADFSSFEDGSADRFLKQLHALSPETLTIAVVDSVDEALVAGRSIYDFIARPLLRSQTLLAAVDRACEKLYYLYKVEQLAERLQPGAVEENSPDARIFELSSVEILNESSVVGLYQKFIAALRASPNASHGLQAFFGLFYENVEKTPLLYLRYIPRPAALVVAHCAGLPAEQFRGVGVELGEAFEGGAEVLNQSKFAPRIDGFLAEITENDRFEKAALNVKGQFSGLLVAAGGFKTVQARDLFYSLAQLLQFFSDCQKTAFERQADPVFASGTGLYHRHYFETCLAREVSRARRVKQPVSLVSLRIDGFADYKRRAGEEFARKLLAAVAEVLRRTSRDTDLLADLQGGDFAVLLPHTEQQGAAVKAEKIRRIVENAVFPHAEILPAKKITVSCGVGEYPGTSRDAESLRKSAEDALFYVQGRGGNRVYLATVVEGFRPDFEAGR